MVGVVPAGGHGLHQLADRRDRGIAGVVVDVLEARVDGGAVVVLQYLEIVAVVAEDRLENVKMDGTHLGGEDGVVLLLHLLGVVDALERLYVRGRMDPALAPHGDGGEQRADADAHRAEVVDLVNLEAGVELAALLQKLADLVGRDGVKAAAERVELNELKIVAPADEFRRGVEAGVIDPLVIHAHGALGDKVDGQAILGQHRQAVGRDELGDAVVDLGVDVVGPSGQHNAAAAVFLHVGECLRARGADVGLGPALLFPREVGGMARFLFGNVPGFLAELDETVGGDLLVRESEEGMEITHRAIGHGFDVVLDILGIRDDDWAVEVVLRARHLLMLVEHAGMEDGLDAVVDEPLGVTVGELGRIALGFRRDALHAQLVDRARGERGEDDAEAEVAEERRPERIVFVHVQYARDADLAARRIFRLERGIGEYALTLVGEDIFAGFGSAFAAQRLFAAVAAHMAAAAGEDADREHAVVLAALTACGRGLVRELLDLLKREHCALLPVVAVAREQCRAERAHDARDVGTRDLRARDALKRAQHGLVEECAALYDDVRAELARVGELDDLIKSVLDDGVGKAGGDIGDACALLLRLLDVGVHKYGAARAEVHGGLGKECFVREFLRCHAKRVGEILEERAAAGRAGLVQKHRVDRAVLELDTLHVLSADIEHAVDLRVEERRGGAVGDGLDLALVERERGLEQRFAVARGAGARDMRARGKMFAQRMYRLHGGLDGIALIVGVERVQKLALFAN